MKALPLVLNGILAVAVAILFYFQFANNKPEARKNTVDSAVIDSISSTLKIAYINQDTLWKNYKLIDDLQSALELERGQSEKKVEQRSALLEKQLEQMATELQTKAAKFEENAKGMNEVLRNSQMQELQSLQQNAQAFSMEAEQEVGGLQQSLSQKLMEKELEGTKKVTANIKKFLAEYNQEYGFSYVLAYSDEAGGILLGNPALDITADVVAGLNAIYDAEKAAEEAAKKK
ncbi:MAG: OmpH family outer membrane protein [Flavobacteriales bacterium]|nr:OmpH family outer membrane protein [Flavobacteriales bacterium]